MSLGAARPAYVAHGLWNFVNGAPIFEGINVDPGRAFLPTCTNTTGSTTSGSSVQDDFKDAAQLNLQHWLAV